MKWFLETRTPTSTGWMATLYEERPTLDKHMRIGMTTSRARTKPVEVKSEHCDLSLCELQGIYGGGAQ